MVGLFANLAHLFPWHTPPPVRLVVQELAQDATGTVLLGQVQLHSLLIWGQALLEPRFPRGAEDNNRRGLTTIPASPTGFLGEGSGLVRCANVDHLADIGVVEPDSKSRGSYNHRLVSITKPAGDNSSLLFLGS